MLATIFNLATLTFAFATASAPPTFPASAAATSQRRSVSPIRWLELTPALNASRELILVAGHTFELGILVRDDVVLPQSLELSQLPAGASYSPQDQVLRWSPTAAQRGRHLVRVTATTISAGVDRQEVVQFIAFVVQPNHAPTLTSHQGNISFHVKRGNFEALPLTYTDVDGDQVSVSLLDAPPCVRYEAEAKRIVCTRDNQPQSGTYEFSVVASDGIDASTTAITMLVLQSEEDREFLEETQQEWDSWMIPGLGYEFFHPKRNEVLGEMHGLAIELLWGAWIHQNEKRGPSHGRIYLKADIFESTKLRTRTFSYAIGTSLSLERNPKRNWLIPTFGLEVGGIVFPDKHLFQTTPQLGMHFYANRRLFVTAHAGYRITPIDLDGYGGWTGGLSANLVLW